jgi:hypothetical protein
MLNHHSARAFVLRPCAVGTHDGAGVDDESQLLDRDVATRAIDTHAAKALLDALRE